MCVSIAPANFRQTLLYGGINDLGSTTRHVIGYQNTAQNLNRGPNAMVLHVPAVPGSLTPRNIHDMSEARHVLSDMMMSNQPKSRGMTFGGMGRGFEVFDRGIYTVVLVPEPSSAVIEQALLHVSPEKRPVLSGRMVDFYARNYPGWALLLFCFNTRAEQESEPVFYDYEPLDPTWLHLPALDCHTGNTPLFDEPVEVDHMVMVGVDGQGTPGAEVSYSDSSIPLEVRRLLPKTIRNTPIHTTLPNADFFIRTGTLGTKPEVQRGKSGIRYPLEAPRWF